MSSDKTRAIIWDLDGTLIDSFDITVEAAAQVLSKHGLTVPDKETFRHHFHGSLQESIASILGEGVKEKAVEAVVRDFLQTQNLFYEAVEHHIFSDAFRLAKRACEAGLLQVIVTNRYHANRLNASPRSIVERSSLKEVIDEVISGDDSLYRKPDVKVVEHLLEKHKLMPSATLVIGDQFVDALLAKNLGSKAVLVARDGREVPHLERLGGSFEHYTTIVRSLDEVRL